MIRHDVQLWAYAAKELELGDHRYVEAHLEDCPECTEQLASVQVAKEALELARDARPRVAWAHVDERIGAMVEKRLASQARRPMYLRLGVVGLGFAAAAAAVLTLAFPRQEPRPLPATEQPAPISSWARVDRAQGLSRVDGSSSELLDGTELRGGDVLRTSKVGKAYVHLPDGSHLRVGGASQLALTRSEADDVALTLERGSLAVRASHQARKAFVVHSGGLSVNVIGTVFSVTNDAEQVEVSVTEGQVRVELPTGESTFVEPGQRLRFDSKTQRSKRLKLSPANERELAEITAVADATTSVEQRGVVAAVGGSPSAPPMLTAQGTPRSLPRLSAAEARARQVSPPVVEAPKEQPKTELIVEGPAEVWPTLGGGEIVRGVPAPREPVSQPAQVEVPPVSQPTEWAEAPKPSVEEWAPLPVPAAPAPLTPSGVEGATNTSVARLTDEPAPTKVMPKDLEMIFLQRAEDSIEKGTCDRFLLGLEDIALDAERNARSEQARVLRARCFDTQMRPRQAMNEYRKYLEAYPRGRFSAEAHQALGE
ncbi:MAG: FecR domain-containing protein [Archangium sp.]|nr:FecR domain-containing protein [Archangium sp.]